MTAGQIKLIKMAITGSQMLETAFKTRVKKASDAGATIEEMQHAIIQLLPIMGLGRTVMAAKWLDDAVKRT